MFVNAFFASADGLAQKFEPWLLRGLLGTCHYIARAFRIETRLAEGGREERTTRFGHLGITFGSAGFGIGGLNKTTLHTLQCTAHTVQTLHE